MKKTFFGSFSHFFFSKLSLGIGLIISVVGFFQRMAMKKTFIETFLIILIVGSFFVFRSVVSLFITTGIERIPFSFLFLFSFFSSPSRSSLLFFFFFRFFFIFHCFFVQFFFSVQKTKGKKTEPQTTDFF